MAAFKFPPFGLVTPGFALLAASSAALLLGAGGFLLVGMTRGGAEISRALREGQRAVITIKDGGIEGDILKTSTTPATPAPTAAATAESPATATPPTPAPAAPSTAVAPSAPPSQATAPPLAATVTVEPPATAAPVTPVTSSPTPAPAPLPEAASSPSAPVPPATVSPPPATTPAAPRAPATPEKTEVIPEPDPVTSPLQSAPNSAFLEASGEMKLPTRSKDGAEPWQYYSKPVTAGAKTSVIALVVTGLGLDENHTARARALPEFVSLSFSPYAPNLAAQMEKARDAGHEAWVDLPMEPDDYPASDPGPLALMKDLPDADNLARLHKLLATVGGVTGLVASDREVFSQQKGMEAVAKELETRGLLLLLRSKKAGVAGPEERTVVMNRRLDERAGDAAATEELFGELEAVAKSNGYAIGVLDQTPALFDAIRSWAKTLAEKKVALQSLAAVQARVNG